MDIAYDYGSPNSKKLANDGPVAWEEKTPQKHKKGDHRKSGGTPLTPVKASNASNALTLWERLTPLTL